MRGQGMEEGFVYTLPSPTDTPYRTPSSTRSQRSHPYDDMSPSSTPPPMPEERMGKRRSNDSNLALDENISPLDPRRFTPTLHASLVSEILSLRRDLESRTKDIEQLELSLHQAQSQNEGLNNNLLSSNKEMRSIKRQMQLLEGGTLSAINELAKERDEALKDVSDLRHRLEQSQKRAKSHEDGADRTQLAWDKDRENWLAEKRGLETKVHVVEGRLKVVLNEIANVQGNHRPAASPERQFYGRNGVTDSPSKTSINGLRGRRHSGASVNSDHMGGRVSALSFAVGNGTNLADELAFDEETESQLNGDPPETGRISPDALPEEQMRSASSLSIKARKVLGLPLDLDDHHFAGDQEYHDDFRRQKTANYVDTAIQFSPPSSPGIVPESKRTTSMFSDFAPHANRLSMRDGTPGSPTESFDSRFAPWNVIRPMMVSVSCQTIEALPSPPLTPDKTEPLLATIPESPLEPCEVTNCGTQTEAVIIVDQKDQMDSSAGFNELQVPTIAIIPPSSRPATPTTKVVLPPRTRNASAQVNMLSLGSYQSSSMQTEEIRVDKRAITGSAKFPPGPVSNPFKPPTSNRSIPQVLNRLKPSTGPSVTISRRAGPSSAPSQSTSQNAPQNDTGPLARDFAQNLPPPLRSSSMFAGFDDPVDNREEQPIEEGLAEDDIFSRPTAKFTLKFGKLVSSDPGLEDIGESAAANAGEAAALENLRLSEDSLPPEMRTILSQTRISPRRKSQRQQQANKSLKRVPSAKSNNMRRAALISSGAAVHRTSHSQSTNASVDSANPPPFPVPLRYSSARIGKSVSEGGRSSPTSSAASPTKRTTHKGNRHFLRKARSGPAISPNGQPRRSRSRSPPVDPRVSIVPEMPSFQMPNSNALSFLSEPYSEIPEASAPRPSVATGPNRKPAHIKTNSDAVSMHQTSVVDSIAQTMVGEWMYKYVRRRKSFGVTDKSNDWDPNKNPEEISANVTNSGTRHKRWVWLAPYERAVMWSSKQPTSGTALLGKNGRKLTIKSVLDVKDDNPMPKGSITGPHFNRSILILTPERALKFTATSQDRHYIWLTALSFLSHSPLSVNDLTAIPPPPPDDQIGGLPSPTLAGSFRRRQIRDSIRVAKDSSRGGGGFRSFTTDGSLPVQNVYERAPVRDYYDPTSDPALPPTIKRFHNRNRSNTAPRAPPSSFRNMSGKDVVPSLPPPGSTYSGSVLTTTVGGSSDRGLYTPSVGVHSVPSTRRGSESSAASRPPFLPHIFQDPSQQTMRMDAFIDSRNQPTGRPSNSFRGAGGPVGGGGVSRRKDLAYWGIQGGRDSISPVDSLLYNEMVAASSSTRASEDSRDPFKGF